MKRMLLVFLLLTLPLTAWSATLSWDAVTTYTDGSAISGAVTYQPFWATDAALTTQHNLGSAIAGTSVPFSIDTEGMPRGSSVYFSVRAIASGVASANANPLSWPVPNKAPSAPGNLRIVP